MALQLNLKQRTEQIEVEFDATGEVVNVTFSIIVHKDDIWMIRLMFEREYQGVKYGFVIRENGLKHFGDAIIAVYDMDKDGATVKP